VKIITKDNFDRDLFTEKVIAENVNEFIGKQMVQTWNYQNWKANSEFYLALVDDNYKCYDGYKELCD
jgi:hypothetical protein